MSFQQLGHSPDYSGIEDVDMDNTPEMQWEQQTIELIRSLEQDKLAKAEQRLAAVQRTVDEIRQQVGTLRGALDIFRAAHGMTADGADVVDPAEVAMYQGMSPREMLLRWADTHESVVVMKDAARFLAAAGLFKDHVQAAGTLYPTVQRMPDEFIKLGRGVYGRRPTRDEQPPPLRLLEQERGAPCSLDDAAPAVKEGDDALPWE